jgi:hypothetical protein
MDNQPVNDGFITADFIGGVWDEKTYDIPFVPEWRVAILPAVRFINKPPESAKDLVNYDVAVYKYIGHGAYLINRIEKNG